MGVEQTYPRLWQLGAALQKYTGQPPQWCPGAAPEEAPQPGWTSAPPHLGGLGETVGTWGLTIFLQQLQGQTQIASLTTCGAFPKTCSAGL